MDSWKSNIKAGIQQGLGILLVLLFAGLFLVAAYSRWPSLHYRNAFLPKSDVKITLQAAQTKTLNELVSKGIVISAADLYNDTLAYYNALISWLIGLLGVSALVGFIYLRGKSQEEAEKQAAKAVDDYFAKESTHRMLENKVRTAIENDDDLDGMRETLARLEEKGELLTTSSQTIPPGGNAQQPATPPAPASLAPTPAPTSLPAGNAQQPAALPTPASPEPAPAPTIPSGDSH